MAKLLKRYTEPYIIKLRLFSRDTPVLNDTWRTLNHTYFVSGDKEGIFDDLKKSDYIYYVPLTSLYRDKRFSWSVALFSSFVQFKQDPAGLRVVQVAVAEYSTAGPKEDWDDEFGTFVDWRGVIQDAPLAPPEARSSIVPLQRDEISVSTLGDGSDPKNDLYISVLVYQNSTQDLSVLNSDISLVFRAGKI